MPPPERNPLRIDNVWVIYHCLKCLQNRKLNYHNNCTEHRDSILDYINYKIDFIYFNVEMSEINEGKDTEDVSGTNSKHESLS